MRVLVMLDCSPKRLKEKSEQFGMEFGQLRTPLTRNKLAGVTWGLDNGCYSDFRKDTWRRMVNEAASSRQEPKFVCLPDIVGNARRTLELFNFWLDALMGLPPCLVLQDGIGDLEIPWHALDAVFIGGSDDFKYSSEAMDAAKAARYMGKWVHVGRVNTAERVKHWMGVADSIDGSGITKYDHMLSSVVAAITGDDGQTSMFGGEND